MKGGTDMAAPDTTRLADMLREYRGDSHTAAWISAGLDATEIGLLSELYWGLPMRSYSRTRAWSEAEFTAAHERLQQRGLVDEVGFTEAGRSLREAIEVQTDLQMQPSIAALGSDLDELLALMSEGDHRYRYSVAWIDLVAKGSRLGRSTHPARPDRKSVV